MLDETPHEPVFPQQLVGVRCWEVTAEGYLAGVHHQTIWRPGVTASSCPQRHIGPVPDCVCGLHAYHTWHDLLFRQKHSIKSNQRIVVGVVIGRGQSTVHEHGWRSEEAVIVALAPVPTEKTDTLARQAAQRYGVPVIKPGELMDVAAQYGPPVKLQQVPAPEETNNGAKESVATVPRMRPWRAARKNAILFGLCTVVLSALLALMAFTGPNLTETWSGMKEANPVSVGLIQPAYSLGHLDGKQLSSLSEWQRRAPKNNAWIDVLVQYLRQHARGAVHFPASATHTQQVTWAHQATKNLMEQDRTVVWLYGGALLVLLGIPAIICAICAWRWRPSRYYRRYPQAA